MASGNIQTNRWQSCGTATGTATITITDFDNYEEFYIQLYYGGYVVNWLVPRKAFASSDRTLAFSYSTTSNVPFNGNIRYRRGTVRLISLQDYTGTDVSASAQIDILGRA